MTDGELIRAYAESQDDRGFAELVSRHQQAIYRACLRMLGDSHEAQDVAQATFIVLARKASELRKDGSLSGWLHNVARKVALEAIRRRTVRAKRVDDFVGQFVACDSGAEPEVDAEIVLKSVDEALGELSERLREAVILRYVQGYSQKDAAELAGCPQGTFGRRAHDGLAKLRERLVKRGIPVSAVVLTTVFDAEAHAGVPETLLSSITSASKAIAAGAAVGAGATPAMLLAEGTMRAMIITKIKLAAMVAMGVAVVGGGMMIAVQAANHSAEGVTTMEGTSNRTELEPESASAQTNSPFWQYGSRAGRLALLNSREDKDAVSVREERTKTLTEMFELSKVIDAVYTTNKWSPRDLRSVIEGAFVGAGVRFGDSAGPALDKLCEDFMRQNEGTVIQYDMTTLTMKCSDNICVLASNTLDLVREEDQAKVKEGWLRVRPLQQLDDAARR